MNSEMEFLKPSTSIILHFPVTEVVGTFDRLVVIDRRRQRKYRAVESRTREFAKLWNGLLLLAVRFLHFLLNRSGKNKQHTTSYHQSLMNKTQVQTETDHPQQS